MPPAELPARKRWLALAVLCVTVLVANLDSTVLNVALPTLVRDLNATSGDLQWIVDSYIVVFAGSLLAAGSLADRIGRKKTLLAGLAVFAGGSAWAAFSGDVGTLIAARASMGIGGALMIPSTLSIISNMFRDPAERQHAIGRWGGTSGIGVALGPIIGGFLLARFWWGSVFLLNVPIAMAGLLAAYWLVPDSRNPAAKAPDLAGAGLSMAGIGVILWSIIEAPTRGWSSPLVIGAGAVGLAVLALFAVWERITDHPMLNLSFFRQRPFSAAIPAVVTLTFGLFGALFVLTQFLQLALGFTALQAGIRLLPVAAAVIVVAPASAVSVRAIGPKFTIAAGLALVAAGLWLISGCRRQHRLRPSGGGYGPARHRSRAGAADGDRLRGRLGASDRQRRSLRRRHHGHPARRRARRGGRRQPAGYPLPGPDDRRPVRSAAPRHRQELPRRRTRRRPGRRHHRRRSSTWPRPRSSAAWTWACSPAPWSPSPAAWSP